MRIIVPISLELEVPDNEAAAYYLDPAAPVTTATATVTAGFLADLFDIWNDQFSEELISINQKTLPQIKQELQSTLP